MVKHLEQENLQDVIKEGVYLVDFYAEWCGPCKMLAPVLETLENIEVIKVNVDEHRSLVAEFGVMSIPTLIFMKDGVEVHKEIGFRSKEELEQIISHIK